ncbi:hypothetical protein SISSUDRAFT_1038300 [Sistotremastrum suecicum HHB10207 ss-3]|uniref:Uncharacterized protein n=1 Tax=Sistotremastrum suecicum HHB10207 ss-3 TaxID=1314776 RepID=A0A165WXY1_9AGAM|nr:hypothetical protein SISSUDRAFT_1038300 [Sistotremastrum suecicum HHB10207 ss-3]
MSQPRRVKACPPVRVVTPHKSTTTMEWSDQCEICFTKIIAFPTLGPVFRILCHNSLLRHKILVMDRSRIIVRWHWLDCSISLVGSCLGKGSSCARQDTKPVTAIMVKTKTKKQYKHLKPGQKLYFRSENKEGQVEQAEEIAMEIDVTNAKKGKKRKRNMDGEAVPEQNNVQAQSTKKIKVGFETTKVVKKTTKENEESSDEAEVPKQKKSKSRQRRNKQKAKLERERLEREKEEDELTDLEELDAEKARSIAHEPTRDSKLSRLELLEKNAMEVYNDPEEPTNQLGQKAQMVKCPSAADHIPAWSSKRGIMSLQLEGNPAHWGKVYNNAKLPKIVGNGRSVVMFPAGYKTVLHAAGGGPEPLSTKWIVPDMLAALAEIGITEFKVFEPYRAYLTNVILNAKKYPPPILYGLSDKDFLTLTGDTCLWRYKKPGMVTTHFIVHPLHQSEFRSGFTVGDFRLNSDAEQPSLKNVKVAIEKEFKTRLDAIKDPKMESAKKSLAQARFLKMLFVSEECQRDSKKFDGPVMWRVATGPIPMDIECWNVVGKVLSTNPFTDFAEQLGGKPHGGVIRIAPSTSSCDICLESGHIQNSCPFAMDGKLKVYPRTRMDRPKQPRRKVLPPVKVD